MVTSTSCPGMENVQGTVLKLTAYLYEQHHPADKPPPASALDSGGDLHQLHGRGGDSWHGLAATCQKKKKKSKNNKNIHKRL